MLNIIFAVSDECHLSGTSAYTGQMHLVSSGFRKLVGIELFAIVAVSSAVSKACLLFIFNKSQYSD